MQVTDSKIYRRHVIPEESTGGSIFLSELINIEI
jgi:hypothetical protein